jgi:hypothetical protein
MPDRLGWLMGLFDVAAEVAAELCPVSAEALEELEAACA